MSDSHYSCPSSFSKEKWRRLLQQLVNAVTLEDIEANNMRTLMYGLASECPHGGNPLDSRLFEIRKMPYAERVNWVKSLSQMQV